jgi:hypothetical protein
LDETIWSLTSPRAKRISGSKNLLSSPQDPQMTLLLEHWGGVTETLHRRCDPFPVKHGQLSKLL